MRGPTPERGRLQGEEDWLRGPEHDHRGSACNREPRTEVFFADTHDAVGPLGAKGMGEWPINPVSPALANALADATGVRFRDLPFTPDRIYRRIFERHVV